MDLRVKNLPAMQETQGMWVWSLGWEDLLEKEMATHCSILENAWRILWTEEPGGLQSTVSQRVGQDWTTKRACTHNKHNRVTGKNTHSNTAKLGKQMFRIEHGKIGSGKKFPSRCLKTETSLAFLRNKKAGKGGGVVVGKGERRVPEAREDRWG